MLQLKVDFYRVDFKCIKNEELREDWKNNIKALNGKDYFWI